MVAKTQRDAHPGRVALLASLVLHAGVLAVLFVLRPRAPPAEPAKPIKFDLIWHDQDLHGATVTGPTQPSAAPAPRPPMRVPSHSLPPSIRRPRPGPALATPEVAPLVPAPSPSTSPDGPVVPVAPPARPAPPVPARPPDLFSRDALSHAAERDVHPHQVDSGRSSDFAPLPGESAGEYATNERDRVTARVVGATVDSSARSRVQAGLVDPSYAAMGRAMLDAWNPDRALPETSAALWAKNRAENAVVAARLWQEAGANYGRTGSPVTPGEEIATTVDARPGDAIGASQDGQRQQETYHQYMQGKFNEGRSAHVLVEEDEDRVRVSLVQSSGDLELDRAALEDVRHALDVMRRDHPEHKHRKSLWSMRLLILINPPVPVVGFTFDEVLQAPHLELPLDRHLYKHVELEAVYDDDVEQRGAAGRAL